MWKLMFENTLRNKEIKSTYCPRRVAGKRISKCPWPNSWRCHLAIAFISKTAARRALATGYAQLWRRELAIPGTDGTDRLYIRRCVDTSLHIVPNMLLASEDIKQKQNEPLCCWIQTRLYLHRLYDIRLLASCLHFKLSGVAMKSQSSGAVWKSRRPSWAPVPYNPTVSVDLKQHSTNHFRSVWKSRWMSWATRP